MRSLILVMALVIILGFSPAASAALFDRSGGLIYDDVLDITWLQDAKYAMTSEYDADGSMTWDDAVTWAGDLEYYDSVRDVTWNDWRLPRVLPVNGTSYNDWLSYDGSTDWGYNIGAPGSAYPGSTASEMAYMYYNNLGNLAYYDTEGNEQSGWGLLNTGPFINLEPYIYWSGTDYAPVSFRAWCFSFGGGDDYPYWSGIQDADMKNYPYYGGTHAWAVRDGDVPIPGTLLLLGSGLAGIATIRKRWRWTASRTCGI